MLTRDFLKLVGLSIAQRILPPSLLSLWAQAAEAQAKGRKVILVTFGGGVRNSETFSPEGLRNIPRLAALRPEGFFYKTCQNQGVLSHFNSTASIVTGNWQRVDDFGFEAPASATIFEHFRKGLKAGPLDAWVVATNKSFASMGSSSQRDLGLPFGANVVLPRPTLARKVRGLNDVVSDLAAGLQIFLSRRSPTIVSVFVREVLCVLFILASGSLRSLCSPRSTILFHRMSLG